jgi:hypothetical protein
MPVPAAFKKKQALSEALLLASDIHVGKNTYHDHKFLFIWGCGIPLLSETDVDLANEVVSALELLAEHINSGA